MKRRWKLCGPLLCISPCNRHLDSSSVAQFPLLFKRDKGEQASDRLKVTLHHVVLSEPDMETKRWREEMQRHRRTGLVCVQGGGSKVKENSYPQGSCVCPQVPENETLAVTEPPAGPDCGCETTAV